MGALQSMQEVANTETTEWPDFRVRKRFIGGSELLCILLLASGMALGGYVDVLVLLPLLLVWVLVKRRSRYEISLDVGQAGCNSPDLVRGLAVTEFLQGEYAVPGFYRFRSGQSTLWVWAPSYLSGFVHMAERAFTKRELQAALDRAPVAGTYRTRGLGLAYLFLLVIYTQWGFSLHRTLSFIAENRPLSSAPTVLLLIALGAVVFAFVLCLAYRWRVTESAVELRGPYGRRLVPFKSIVTVSLDALLPKLRINYEDGDKIRQASLLQLGLNRSLLPLYFFLRSKASNRAVACDTAPAGCQCE